MNKFESVTKSLRWFIALLMVALVVGCGGTSTDVVTPLSSAKSITSFTIGGVVGTIDQTAKTVALIVPNATPVTAMIATFTVTGGSVSVGTPAVAQVSATTANDFTSPVTYLITAADGSTASYAVTVTVASTSDKAITSFSLNGATGTISGAASPFAIAVSVPFATDVSAMVATFSTTGTGVAVGAASQTSGITANGFTAPVTYTVTAADNSTAAYVVTVTVAASSAKAITSYSLGGAVGSISGASSPYAIAVTVPNGTDPIGLIATFVTTGSSVTVVATGTQVSASTANDFTSPVAYTVHAADSSTAVYDVTVTVAAAPVGAVVCGGASGTDCVDLMSAANYVILDEATVTFTPIATISTTATITGDVAVSPAAASFLTGFSLALDSSSCFSTSTQVVGNLYAADYSSVNGCATATTDTATILTTAVGDKNTAYSAAMGKAPSGGGLVTACPGTGAFDGGVVPPLAAGVYTCGVNVTIPNNFTLDGTATDVWVFQITGSLAQAGATSVLLTGGALPQNVFWIVTNGVAIGANAHMEGVVMSGTNISLLAGASVKGRLFGRTGVLMDSNTVTMP
ncbi:MAG: ice-binding family protein [Sideroxyarcus sp.]|nr:ice-binding family protein [Sideroxyarcus sp.]